MPRLEGKILKLIQTGQTLIAGNPHLIHKFLQIGQGGRIGRVFQIEKAVLIDRDLLIGQELLLIDKVLLIG